MEAATSATPAAIELLQSKMTAAMHKVESGATKELAAAHSTSWSDLDLSKYAFYGSAFVFSVETCMYPFEVLRTRMQADSVIHQRSIVSLAQRIVRQEGWRALFRGIVPAVSGSFPAQATYYTAYEFSQHKYNELIRSFTGRLSLTPGQDVLCHSLAGLTAEACAAVFYLPSDIISQRLQSQPKFSFYHSRMQYNTSRQVARSIYDAHGAWGFYRGIVPHLLAFAPSGAVYWATYEFGKKHTHSHGLVGQAAAASLAGGTAVIVSNPFDVLRTRVQTYESSTLSGIGQIRELASDLWKNEGIRGFYKGVRPRLMIAIPGSMLALMGYELIKSCSRK